MADIPAKWGASPTPEQGKAATVGEDTAPSKSPRKGRVGLVPIQTRRKMKGYNITDVELDVLGMMHWLAVAFFTVSGSLFTLCIEITKDLLLIQGQKNDMALALEFSVYHFGFPLAVVFFILGCLTFLKRGSIIKRIKDESEQV